MSTNFVLRLPKSTRRGVSLLAATVVAAVLLPVGLGAVAPAAGAECTIEGTPGPDVLRGTPGPDVICGMGGDDRLVGGGGPDVLRGAGGNDVLRGAGGEDVLRGGLGDDLLLGGDGNDVLHGVDTAAFVDDLRCGSGADDSVFADLPDVVAANCENIEPNDPPTNITLNPATVAENEPAGTFVGDLDAEDLDLHDSHTFALVGGAGSDDNASFAIDGDDLETAASLDHEADDQLSIRVSATDADGATYEKALTVTVTDVSEAPPVAVDDSYTTDEDVELTLPVSGAGGPAENDTDADGDTLTVTEVSNPTGGTVAIAAGDIHFTPTADACTPPDAGFDYTVSDGHSGTDTGP